MQVEIAVSLVAHIGSLLSVAGSHVFVAVLITLNLLLLLLFLLVSNAGQRIRTELLLFIRHTVEVVLRSIHLYNVAWRQIKYGYRD